MAVTMLYSFPAQEPCALLPGGALCFAGIEEVERRYREHQFQNSGNSQGGTSAYAASNGGRNALTREWAVELLPYGIRVNAIIVAECWTPLYERWISGLPNSQEKLASIVSKIPLENRMTTAEELGNATAFLLSTASSHTTGQLIHVDGGYVHLDRAISQ